MSRGREKRLEMVVFDGDEVVTTDKIKIQ